jgi:hypothetical protein
MGQRLPSVDIVDALTVVDQTAAVARVETERGGGDGMDGSGGQLGEKMEDDARRQSDDVDRWTTTTNVKLRDATRRRMQQQGKTAALKLNDRGGKTSTGRWTGRQSRFTQMYKANDLRQALQWKPCANRKLFGDFTRSPVSSQDGGRRPAISGKSVKASRGDLASLCVWNSEKPFDVTATSPRRQVKIVRQLQSMGDSLPLASVSPELAEIKPHSTPPLPPPPIPVTEKSNVAVGDVLQSSDDSVKNDDNGRKISVAEQRTDGPIVVDAAPPFDGVRLLVDANGQVTESNMITIAPSMSVHDVLYQAEVLNDSDDDGDDVSSNPFRFDVAPSMRTGCHVIASMSGLRVDRKHRWRITVRDRSNEMVYNSTCLPSVRSFTVLPGMKITLSYVNDH